MSTAPAVPNVLTVALDVRHPHVWLGFDAIVALAADCRVQLDWRPVAVALPVPAQDPGADASRGDRHRFLRALNFDRDLTRLVQARGLTLVDPYRQPDPQVFAGALLWLAQQAPQAVTGWLRAVLTGYWRGVLDITSADSLAALLQDQQVDTQGFSDWLARTGAQVVADCDAQLRAGGVFQVPAFILGEELFLGRQHLPMLRWLLGGRTGPAPI